MRLHGLLLASLLSAASARAGIVWRGDFETHDLSQYDSFTVHSERWSFVTAAPTPREGQYAARVELQANDVGPSNLIRTEVSHTPPFAGFEGSDRYYAWSAMGSTTDPLGNFDHQIMFWECLAPVYQQEMSLHVNGTSISFATSPQGGSYQTRWTGTFAFGVWHDFILHVKWSLDPAVGFVELWYDGAQVLAKTFMKTMHANGATPLGSAMHHGLFLGAPRANKPVEVVFLDAAREGTTFADVQPAVMTDAGSGDAGTADAGIDGGADAGALADAGEPADAGTDAGAPPADAGSTTDAGSERDAGTTADAGGDHFASGSCGCDGSSASGLLALAALWWLRTPRRRRYSIDST